MIARDVGRHFSARPQDFWLPEIRHTFDQNDFVLANLETLTNNHMLDYGPVALADTLSHLNDSGILHFGAGPDYSSANAPLLTNINGLPVAFLGTAFIFSSSTNPAGRNGPE